MEKFTYWTGRNRLTTALIALLLLVLVSGTVLSLAMAWRMKEARDEARGHVEENRRRLVNLLVEQAGREARSGDPAMSLPWLLAALREDSGLEEQEWQHRVRIASLLQDFPRLAALWFHERLIQHAAFSPNGRLAATASYDGTVRVWETADGRETGSPRWHTNQGPGLTLVFHVAFSPDGTRVVSAGNLDARIWDASSGALLVAPLEHSNEVRVARFSPDGKWVLTASTDRTARCWDATTGEAVGAVMRHEGGVLTAAWSPDGRRIVTGGRDRIARVWEAGSGMLLAATSEHEREIIHVEFSPDGEHFVSTSRSLQVRVWSASDGSTAAILTGEGAVRHARFSPEGQRLLTSGTDGLARIWDWRAGKVIRMLRHPAGAVVWVDWSDDGRRVLTASSSRLQLWELEHGRPVAPPLPHTHTLCHAELSRDGRHALAVSLDGTARLWGLGELREPRNSLHSGRCAGDGPYLLVRTPEGRMQVENVMTRRTEIRVLPDETARAEAHAFDAQAGKLAVWERGRVTLYQTGRDSMAALAGSSGAGVQPDFRELASWKGPEDCSNLVLSPDGNVVALYGENEVKLLNALSGAPASPALPHGNTVRHASFSGDGRQVLTVSEDSTGRVWDTATGLPRTPPLPHEDLVIFGAFSPDGALVATASHDGTARVWDADTGALVVAPLRHRGAVRAAKFSPNGRLLATVSDQRVVQVWELAGGTPSTPPLVHPSGIHALAFLEEEGPLMAVTEDLQVWLWALPSGLPLTLAGLPLNAGMGPAATPGQDIREGWRRHIPLETRSLGELERFSLLLAGQVVEEEGRIRLVDAAALREAWEQDRAVPPNQRE